MQPTILAITLVIMAVTLVLILRAILPTAGPELDADAPKMRTRLIWVMIVFGVISGCAEDTSVQEAPPAAVEAQITESKVDPVIIALGLFLLAGVLTANTVANDISGALIP